MPVLRTHKDELEEEFNEAPAEMGGGETGEEKKKAYILRPFFRVSLEKYPQLKEVKPGVLYKAEVNLRAKTVGNEDVEFEVVDLAIQDLQKKSPEEIERENEGSYKFRE